jgi:lipoprotein NlpD
MGLALIGALLLSCSGLPLRSDGPRGIYHPVKSGETLSAIARAYHVKLRDLAEINHIDNPDRLEADSVIFIPDVSQVVDDVLATVQSQQVKSAPPVAETPEATKKKTATPKEPAGQEKTPVMQAPPEQATVKAAVKGKAAPSREADKSTLSRPPPAPAPGATVAVPLPRSNEADGKGEGLQFDKDRFIWPVKGKVISRFGKQPNKMKFNGIRIAAAEGVAVLAAADGVVIFSADLKGYGETIIIKHEDAYATVYTHLETRTVRKDARVKKGDRIAFLGRAENQEEPYLHFEIRYKTEARDPLPYLPEEGVAGRQTKRQAGDAPRGVISEEQRSVGKPVDCFNQV